MQNTENTEKNKSGRSGPETEIILKKDLSERWWRGVDRKLKDWKTEKMKKLEKKRNILR